MKKYFSIALIVISFLACNTKMDYQTITHNPNLYANTVHELNQVVMGNNFSPIVASRNYAYAAIAGYEVTAAGKPNQYQSLAGQLKGLSAMPTPKDTSLIDFPYASVVAFCMVGEAVTFPEGSLKEYTDSLHQLVKAHGMSNKMIEASEGFAKEIGKTIIAWSKKDNYARTRTAERYTEKDIPPAGLIEYRYVHLTNIYLSRNSFIFNLYDKYKMSTSSKEQEFERLMEYKNIKSEYYKNVMMVKEAVENLTEEQKHIANFWDDNPFKINVNGHAMFSTKKFSPPGHWMSIVGIANKTAKTDFATATYAYAKTGITLFDAFIHCWDAKYAFNTVRPETVINKYFDPNWRPLLQTPAFPEYTCGHSTISSAAAEALTSVYGDNFAYTDSTELEFGIANRSFSSFRAAAEENNWARFYGGLHYHNSCITSTEKGRQVGSWIVGHLKMKK